ncbi:MAG: hypothetical protein IKU43_02370 [Clostridia bacterium]|nr:hypothetical protein [Clostridia bacterium]
MKSIRKPKIGLLLIGSPRFKSLGDGTRDGKYADRKLIEADRIKAEIGDECEIIFDEVVYDAESARRTVKIFREKGVDCAAATFLSWAEDAPWINFLQDIGDLPLLYFSIVREEIPYETSFDESDFVDFLSCGSMVGFLEGSGDLKRYYGDKGNIFLGSLCECAEKIRSFARASRAKAMLRNSTVSLLSCYNEVMWSTYVDPYNIFKTFGATLHFLSIAELVDCIDKADDGEMEEICRSFLEKYRHDDDLDYEKFKASVRASFAMEELAKSKDTDLLVLNDVDRVLFEKVGLRPGFYPTRDSIELCCVPEGDIGAGLATYILHLVSGNHVNFIEPFYIDKKNNSVSCGHAGPCDFTECPENVIIGKDTRFAKSGYKYAGAPFAWYVYPAGLKTMVHMSECNGKLKMIFTTMECLPTKHHLASYSHANMRHPYLSHEELFTRLAKFGVTQHYAICKGDYMDELEQFAKIAGIEYERI